MKGECVILTTESKSEPKEEEVLPPTSIPSPTPNEAVPITPKTTAQLKAASLLKLIPRKVNKTTVENLD
jgi:hypothetical protein